MTVSFEFHRCEPQEGRSATWLELDQHIEIALFREPLAERLRP